uniref:Uncharacterized protein n=2 Tax=Araneus ventricosus TaxID=182803 RepID=A0A4Y2IYE8_ARAVE|nr:hypothetical protein AVEN_259071-1 [Araneus ventricosus]GBM82600.1 hypothetical protein AVEN_86439-1 [Araneus ventricosus]
MFLSLNQHYSKSDTSMCAEVKLDAECFPPCKTQIWANFPGRSSRNVTYFYLRYNLGAHVRHANVMLKSTAHLVGGKGCDVLPQSTIICANVRLKTVLQQNYNLGQSGV